MKHALRIDVPEGVDSALAKELVITPPLVGMMVKKLFLYFEEREDSTWRITHTSHLFPDFTQVQAFVFDGDLAQSNLRAKKLTMRIEGTGHVWEIGAVVLAASRPTGRFIWFDQMPSGKWKLVLSRDLLDGIDRLISFTMIRED